MIATATKFDADYARPCMNHPHDPRTPMEDDEDPTLDVISDVRSFLAIGEVAAKKGDLGKARYALAEACKSIREFIGEDQ